MNAWYLTFSWWRSLSYRNQSIYMLCKSMDWFLYRSDLHHERVNKKNLISLHLLMFAFVGFEVQAREMSIWFSCMEIPIKKRRWDMYILRTSKWLLEYLVLLFHPKRLLIFFWFCLVFRTSVWLRFYGLNHCVSASRLFGRLVTVFSH